jgi:hypothetical protein
METNHEPLHSRQMTFGAVKKMEMPKSFILIFSLCDEAFNYGDGAKF